MCCSEISGRMCPDSPFCHAAMAQFVGVALRGPSLCLTHSHSNLSSIMADVPIWSDNERIDSEAVLVSDGAWKKSLPRDCCYFLRIFICNCPSTTSRCVRTELTMSNTSLHWPELCEVYGGSWWVWLPMDACRLDQDVFSTLSTWYVVLQRSSARVSSDHWFSKLNHGQPTTSVVSSGDRNGYTESWREIWRNDAGGNDDIARRRRDIGYLKQEWLRMYNGKPHHHVTSPFSIFFVSLRGRRTLRRHFKEKKKVNTMFASRKTVWKYLSTFGV